MIFFRVGGFTFGGGYAMLPAIQKEFVEDRKWATYEEIIDYYAIGQCTPGIIAVNTATFIGYKRKGILGGIAGTLGMVAPSLIIITTIATFFKHFQDIQIVQHAFGGIRVVVAALIANTVIKMATQSIKDWVGIILFFISLLAVAILNTSPIIVIVAASLIGIIRCRNIDFGEEK
ncbi:MAG: chromate transporter [Tissierellaceae bacterium]|nr:chromate transporter [Tissierellaceae bacterium]